MVSSQFHEVEYEYIPSLYFNNGVHSKDVRLAFLSFYQVVEYFFVRTQNYAFLDEFKLLQENLDHGLLRIVLQKKRVVNVSYFGPTKKCKFQHCVFLYD